MRMIALLCVFVVQYAAIFCVLRQTIQQRQVFTGLYCLFMQILLPMFYCF